VLQGCPRLQALHLYGTKGFPQAVTAPNAQHLSNLEILEIHHLDVWAGGTHHYPGKPGEHYSASFYLPVNLRHLCVHRFQALDTACVTEADIRHDIEYYNDFELASHSNEYWCTCSLEVLLTSPLHQLVHLHLSAIGNCHFKVSGLELGASSSLRSLNLESVEGLPLSADGVLDLRGLSRLTRASIRECTGVKSVEAAGCTQLSQPVEFVPGSSRRYR
jgi:hypothetical protein